MDFLHLPPTWTDWIQCTDGFYPNLRGFESRVSFDKLKTGSIISLPDACGIVFPPDTTCNGGLNGDDVSWGRISFLFFIVLMQMSRLFLAQFQ